MQILDDIGDPIPQAPTCGALTQFQLNELANSIEHREYIDRAPLLQLPFHDAMRDPLFSRYAHARLAIEYAKPVQKVTTSPDDWATSRRFDNPTSFQLVTEKRETGGLRRAADLWARLHKAHKDFLESKRISEREIAREKRATNKRTLDYWSERLAV
jgi:hypothetical protein